MCGRYTLHGKSINITELQLRFKFLRSVYEEFPERYNVAPTQEMPVVFENQRTKERILNKFRWGLIPFWAKDPSIGYKTINARCETLTEKPTYRKPFANQRCLIPASGFYEWEKVNPKTKIPHMFRLNDDEILGFAGLYEKWKSPEDEDVWSYSIVTTEANDLVGQIHPRMPVILHPDEYDFWLDPENHNTDELSAILKPYPADQMTSWIVSTEVNNTRNDYPELISKVG